MSKKNPHRFSVWSHQNWCFGLYIGVPLRMRRVLVPRVPPPILGDDDSKQFHRARLRRFSSRDIASVVRSGLDWWNIGEPDAELMKKGYTIYRIGVDEVGYGPWAGPIVVVACWIKSQERYANIRDSKAIRHVEMKEIYDFLNDSDKMETKWAQSKITAETLDNVYNGNNLKARLDAAAKAIHTLCKALETMAKEEGRRPYFKVLIDGTHVPKDMETPTRCVHPLVSGDDRVQEISAASILAKYTRDEEMRGWHEKYPQYGFDTNVGYGSSKKHQDALYEYGSCPLHRHSWKPLQSILYARQHKLPNPYDRPSKKKKSSGE